MKKQINKFILVILNIILFLCIINVNSVFANDSYTTEYASYKENTRLIEQDLGYGVEHIKTTAYSTANTCNNPAGYGTVDSPQVVNILSVPSAKNIRVVNYTYPNQNGWTKQTLSKLVQNFELNNPGWTVLAGVNGDFYDINGLDKELPYHTTGTTVSNGEVLRAEPKKSIGYSNNGSTNSLQYTENLAFTDYHVLNVIDSNNNVIAEFKIDKINEAPNYDEVALYYTYKQSTESGVNTISVTTPEKDCFIVENPIRCLPTSEPEFYGKGQISSSNKAMTLRFGQFAIVSSDFRITQWMKEGNTIRIQKQVVGDLADCEQIMSVGSTLVENGEVSRDNSDGMRNDRHPRTCVGMKEDGTMMFFVIDGRQQPNNMYGMTQDEQGAMLAYYGCTLGFNVDGGGSSTFGVRDEFGNFQIMNTPSDNKERPVSNVLLITVPELQLQKSEISDNSIKLSYGELSSGIKVENIKVTINGVTKEMTSNELVFDGLTPETEYDLSYNYDITYWNETTNVDGDKYTFTTGKIPPKLDYGYYDIADNKVIIKYSIDDKNSLASFACLEYSGGLEFIDNLGEGKINVSLSSCSKFDFKVDIEYTVGSVPNRNANIEYTLEWQPEELDKELYFEDEYIQIEEIIKTVNEEIKSLSKEEALIIINEAKEKISKIKTKLQIINEYANTKIEEILDSYNIEDYSETNKVELLKIEEQIYGYFNACNSYEAVDEIVNVIYSKIEVVPTLKQELELHKIKKINELDEWILNKEYNKKNDQKISDIITKAVDDINNAENIQLVDQITSETIEKLEQVKQKTCKSNTIIIYSLFTSLITCIYILRKKH